MDNLAEMELNNASRIIAEAAESLRRQAALQKEREAQQLAMGFEVSEIQRRAGGSSNVGEIALSVTAAAQMLLEAATEAQKEVCTCLAGLTCSEWRVALCLRTKVRLITSIQCGLRVRDSFLYSFHSHFQA